MNFVRLSDGMLINLSNVTMIRSFGAEWYVHFVGPGGSEGKMVAIERRADVELIIASALNQKPEHTP